jgi:adenylate kinase
MTNIIFLGAPGSGKGTQAAMIAKDLLIPAISTGEILRNEVANGTEIGKLAKSYMESGKLVPDEIVVAMIKNRISMPDCDKGFILDGFPRNIAQGQVLDEMLKGIEKKINAVIEIAVEDEVIIKRISGRFSCKNCGMVYNRFFNLPKQANICDKCGGVDFESRSDDDLEIVVNRLKTYHDNTKELVEFYRKKHLLSSIDGLKEIPLVNYEIRKILNIHNKN